MNLRDEIINARKEKLGLTEKNTKKIFDLIIQNYKELILDAPRNIMGYSINLIVCNMNGYNKLGSIEKLYKENDDTFYVDMKNSTYLEVEVDEEGRTFADNDKKFKEFSNLSVIENISFSIKELIELCKENNILFRLYTQNDYDYDTAIEIEPFKVYDGKERNIVEYLKQAK